jgi:cyclohexanecarboxylate-CoA ligase
VTLRSGEALTLQDLLAYLDQQKVTKHYFPERLEVLTEMPRTASGKIQKFRLREMANAVAHADS